MLGSTPIGVKSASKKLAPRLQNKPLTTADILGSVIKRPKNKSFFRSISDSIELRFEILRRRPVQIWAHKKRFSGTTVVNVQVDRADSY